MACHCCDQQGSRYAPLSAAFENKEHKQLQRSASLGSTSTSVGSADSASETELWMCVDDEVCIEKMTGKSQVNCRAFAIFEQYGVFGASLGAWNTPCPDVQQSISEPTTYIATSCDSTILGTGTEAGTVSDRDQMTEILEHYGVLGAPIGLWNHNYHVAGASNETYLAVIDDVDGANVNPIDTTVVESFDFWAFVSCWFLLAVFVGCVDAICAADILSVNVLICAAACAYFHFRVWRMYFLKQADTSICASKRANYLHHVVVC
jgi:hypothetical protein